MTEVYGARHLVSSQSRDAAIHEFASKGKERTYQTSLGRGYRPRWHAFVGSNASPTVNRPTCVRFPFRSGRFRVVWLLIEALRPAVRVVIIETAVGIIALNQATRRRVIFC